MARPFILAVLAAMMLCLPLNGAEARSQTLNLGFVGDSGRPPVGAKVDVLDMQGNKLGSGTVGADDNVKITFDLPDGVDKVLVDVDTKDAQGRGTSAVIDLTNAAPNFTQFVASGVRTADLVVLINAAAARCDKAAYDRWVAELDRKVVDLEKELEKRQQAAEAYARENELRVTDYKGAAKELDRAAKAQKQLDPALRNEAALDNLRRYRDLLERVETTKRDLEGARRAREAVPPFPEDCKKDKKVGMVPGQKTCPDGSGGLLAGVLNDAFDTDLDPACEDENRRDTDRPKKDREHREHRRD